jgi:uncharacterized repeat protein (TIGR01451 family)
MQVSAARSFGNCRRSASTWPHFFASKFRHLVLFLVILAASAAHAIPPTPGDIIPSTATLHLGDDVRLDSSVSVRVRSDENSIDLNDVGLQLSPSLAEENQPGVLIGALTAFSLTSSDSISLAGMTLVSEDPRYEIVGNQLLLVVGFAFNFEEQDQFRVAIAATVNSTGESKDLFVNVGVIDVNEAPTQIDINGSLVQDNTPGEIVGDLTVLDEDISDTHTFTLSDDRFEVTANAELKLKDDQSLDLNEKVTVTVTATDAGGLSISTDILVVTNVADIPPTPSALQLFQIDPTGLETLALDTQSCASSTNPVVISPAFSDSFNLPGVNQFAEASIVEIGGLLVVKVQDTDKNLSPRRIDFIDVIVSGNISRDSESLTLKETELASGEFIGYLSTTTGATAINDCTLSVATGESVTAAYTDAFDASDRSSDTAGFSPTSRVFDADTGQLISGVIITLVNVDTNQAATVFGDGADFASFSSALKTGEALRDKAGVLYDFRPGQYRFPVVAAGNYRFELFNPKAYEIFAYEDSQEASLPAGFSLRAGSRGDVFSFAGGTLGAIDIPLRRVVENQPDEPTPSTIEFLQYSANPSIGSPVAVGAAQCVTGSGIELVDLGRTGDTPVPVPGTVNLAPVDSYNAGQPVFIRVTDFDQNADATKIDTVTIDLAVGALNEIEFLILAETGVNTGVFVGYIQSSAEETDSPNNCMLGVAQNEAIETIYTDAFNQTDRSESSILVDPFGVLFDSLSGEPIDGVTIRMINVDTGLPAEVFGDGPAFAPYPNVLVTGTSTVDESGQAYDFAPGNYRFPFVRVGNYQLVVEGLPEDYTFPTVKSDEELLSVPGGPYAIKIGSRGDVFFVPDGPPLHIDLPADPVIADVAVTKSGNKSTVAPGDFIQYAISLSNQVEGPIGQVDVADFMPKGFRYVPGSMKINGVQVDDPIQTSARELLVSFVSLDSDAQLTYVAEVTVGAEPGDAVNIASISGPRILVSNTAEYSVRVVEDFLQSKAIVVGRVSLAACEADSAKSLSTGDMTENASDAGVSEENATQPNLGLADIRLYLEDGTTVLTDQDGQWHIEGIEPGTHVVQIDKESIPERYEINVCEGNNRHAGRGFSQFVDVKGGSVWRVDFHLQERPEPQGDVSVTQQLIEREDQTDVVIDVKVPDSVELTKLKTTYRVPRGYQIVTGSSKINGEPVGAKRSMVGYVFELDASRDNQVTLSLKSKQLAKPKSSIERQSLTLRPSFGTRSATLSDADLKLMYETIHKLKDATVLGIEVKGHSDNVPIAPKNRKQYKDNAALSLARADTVANFLKRNLQLATDQVQVFGIGDSEPIANNSSKQGRAANRRVDIVVVTEAAELNTADGGQQTKAKPQISSARLYYTSPGTPSGRTEPNEIVVGSDKISNQTSAVAVGTWDPVEVESEDVVVAGQHAADQQGILTFASGDSLSLRISAVRLDLDSRLTPRLSLDGLEIPRDRIGFKQADDETGKTLYSYIGVDFGESGDRLLRLEGLDRQGNVKFEEEVTVVRTGEVAEIKVLSVADNVADGITPVKVKLQLLDNRGRTIEALTRLELVDGTLFPYNSENDRRQFDFLVKEVEVAGNGLVRFRPVIKGGLYTARVRYGNVIQEIEVFVEPENREWILVGLAEGSVAHNKISGNMENLDAADLEESFNDGRVSFFAKGMIKSDWLMTIAYDTKKRDDHSLLGVIAPNTYYTVYGDASQQRVDAPSAKKLYLRLEKNQFNALFGDFNTGLNVTQLSRYSRVLNGLQTEYVGNKIKVNAFASETSQAFIRDEIRGDGTSGLYSLTGQDIIRNSEAIRIQIRDRLRNEIIIEEKELRPFVDYTIDYRDGTVFFKSPVPFQDDQLNPVFIVAQYEKETDGEEKINAGGRVALKIDDKASEVGVTLVRDETVGSKADLAGVDLTYHVTPSTEVRAEYAYTKSEDNTVSSDGSAYLVEVEHHSEKMRGLVYVRGEDDAFGVGQISDVTSGTQKHGVAAEYILRERLSVTSEIYQDVDKEADETRTVVEARLQQSSEDKGYFVGVRTAQDDLAAGKKQSNQLTLGGNMRMLDDKLNLSAITDTSLGGKGENADFPTRLGVTADYRVTDAVSLVGTQEFSWGDAQDTQNTNVGLRYTPWKGANVSSGVQSSSSENGERTFANVGLQQSYNFNENWAFDFGVDRAQTIKDPTENTDSVNDDKVEPAFGTSNDFTSVSAGANYRDVNLASFTRVEFRQSDNEDKMNVVSGVQRDLEKGIVVFAKVEVLTTETAINQEDRYIVQFAMAYRKPGSKFTILEKLDLGLEKIAGTVSSETRKIVNNLNVNYQYDARTQMSFQYGAKYVLDTFGEDDYSGYTDLIGLQVRHNLSDRWDIGMNGSLLTSYESDVQEYSYGISVGYLAMRNMWLSVGYNFDGFTDDDFTDSEYRAEGVFFKFRMKFDQDSVREIMDREFWSGSRFNQPAQSAQSITSSGSEPTVQ